MTAREITAAVAFKHRCTPAQLQKDYPHAKRFARPRGEAMAVIRRELQWSFPRIGQWFGGFNHTSVLYACKVFRDHENHLQIDPDLRRPQPTARQNRQDIDELRAKIAQLERIVARAGLLEERAA